MDLKVGGVSITPNPRFRFPQSFLCAHSRDHSCGNGSFERSVCVCGGVNLTITIGFAFQNEYCVNDLLSGGKLRTLAIYLFILFTVVDTNELRGGIVLL